MLPKLASKTSKIWIAILINFSYRLGCQIHSFWDPKIDEKIQKYQLGRPRLLQEAPRRSYEAPKGGPRRIPRALEAILERFWTTWHRFWDQFVACFRFEHFSKRSKSAFDGLGLILDQMALLSRPIFDLFSISRPLQTFQVSISRLTVHFSQTSASPTILLHHLHKLREAKEMLHKIPKCLIKLPSISSYATIHNQWNRTSCNLLCGLSNEPHEFTATCNEVADVANKKCLHCRLHCALTKHLLLCHDT